MELEWVNLFQSAMTHGPKLYTETKCITLSHGISLVTKNITNLRFERYMCPMFKLNLESKPENSTGPNAMNGIVYQSQKMGQQIQR